MFAANRPTILLRPATFSRPILVQISRFFFLDSSRLDFLGCLNVAIFLVHGTLSTPAESHHLDTEHWMAVATVVLSRMRSTVLVSLLLCALLNSIATVNAVQRQRFRVSSTSRREDVTVYTPDGYDAPENSERQYALILLLHPLQDSRIVRMRYTTTKSNTRDLPTGEVRARVCVCVCVPRTR